jgi:hypothetical protein
MMTTITRTNAKDLWRRDGDNWDFAGYDLPDTLPVTVRIIFTDKLCHGEDVQELTYRAEWPNGVYAESFMLLPGWAEVHRETMVASSLAHLAGVDRALREFA